MTMTVARNESRVPSAIPKPIDRIRGSMTCLTAIRIIPDLLAGIRSPGQMMIPPSRFGDAIEWDSIAQLRPSDRPLSRHVGCQTFYA